MSTILVISRGRDPRHGVCSVSVVKPILAITIVMILLLGGVTQLPPEILAGFGEEALSACSPNQRGKNERSAATHLKGLASAQADFRANDRDGDGVNQFWREDVAGLYVLIGSRGSQINLIMGALAAADDRPIGKLPGSLPRKPLNGYWFRAIRHADEDPRSLDPQRFAYVAFPSSPRSGNRIFIIDENNSIRQSSAYGPGGIWIFPTDDEIRRFWGTY